MSLNKGHLDWKTLGLFDAPCFFPNARICFFCALLCGKKNYNHKLLLLCAMLARGKLALIKLSPCELY